MTLPNRETLLTLPARTRTSVLLAIQNSEGCAAYYYGYGPKLHSMPGWLADCQTDVEDFFAALPEHVMALKDRASQIERNIAGVAETMAYCVENEALLCECLATEALEAADLIDQRAAEIQRLRQALDDIRLEVGRSNGNNLHLKRAIH